MAFEKIQEYITTADGTSGTLLIPKIIMPMLVEEQAKALIPRELAAQLIRPAQFPGSTMTQNLITPNTGIIRVVGEGAAVPLSNLDFSTVTYTPLKYGIALRITREMQEDAQFNLLEENIRMTGRRIAENENKLILTALDGAGNTVSGGAAITIANLTQGILNLHNSDFIPTDLIIGYEVLSDLQNIDTFVEFQKVGNTQMLNQGYIGNIFGMNVVMFSTNAAPSATYAKYAYIIDRSKAYSIALKRDMTAEPVTLPTYDAEGVVVTQRIDVKLLRANAVCAITTS